MLLLLREYALVQFKQTGGAWVPTKDDSLLVVAMGRDLHCVPVYLSEADAGEVAARYGGSAQFHPWSRIRSRCEEARADAPYAQYCFPEQMELFRRHMTMLSGGDEDPLDRLEDAVANSLGLANAAEICTVLRSLNRVWVVVDADRDFVWQEHPKMGPQMDLFTAALNALQFIQNLDQPDAGLRPASVDAKGLYSMLAPKHPSVNINRGCGQPWYGSPDTLDLVLKTPAQITEPPATPGTDGTPRESWWKRLLGRQ